MLLLVVQCRMYPEAAWLLLLQVYQIISPYTSRLDNVLELYTGVLPHCFAKQNTTVLLLALVTDASEQLAVSAL